MSIGMQVLALATVFGILAGPVAQATDTGPGSPGDKNGRSGASVAGDTAPGSPGDKNGRDVTTNGSKPGVSGGTPR